LTKSHELTFSSTVSKAFTRAMATGRSAEQWRLRLSKAGTVDKSVTACYLSQVDAQCFLMDDDADVFPMGWAPRRHPALCGCPGEVPSPPSAQLGTSKSLSRYASSPDAVADLPPSELETSPPPADSSSKKVRKPRSEAARRGVIRTLQNCFKKVKRFVKIDIAGAITLCIVLTIALCSLLPCRCENSSHLPPWR
jgi:hypothetical protein